MNSISRKEALSRVGLFVGGVIFGAEALLSGCSPKGAANELVLNDNQTSLLDDLAEIIIPTTPDSAGAKAARVGDFMNTIVSDFYNANERKQFLEGVDVLESENLDKLTTQEKIDFVISLEKEASASPEPHYYLMIKQLTIWGYLTSEVCANELFINAPVPGYYDPNVDYKPGDRFMFPNTAIWDANNKARFHSNS